MKSIKKILYTAMIMVCFIACDLTEYPKNVGSRDTIFGSISGLELYSNTFYRMLPSTYDGVFLDDDYSDIFAGRLTERRLQPNALSPVTSSNWNSYDDWADLRIVNYFIENCEKSDLPGKENFLGLARFFRAYFYYYKVRRFGDVPWIDAPIDPLDEEKLYAGRDSRFFVMEKVLEDLNYAIENITSERDATCTRITKSVARAFKTRVCLYEASLRKYHTHYNMQGTANTWYQEVISAANAITGYSLRQGDNVYRDMFLQKNPYAEETILCVALDGGLQLYNSRNRKTISPTYGNRPALTRRFILTYLNQDGTSFTATNPNWQTMSFVEEIVGRDPRLGQTIRTPEYQRTRGGISQPAPPNLEQSITGYQIIKGCYDEITYDSESRNENAHLIFRYAEVLLNKAEALVELNQMTPQLWSETVGALRERAGITGSTLTTLPTVADPYMIEFYNNKWTDPVMLEVLRERCVELVQEGVRSDDLIRWRLGELFEAVHNGMYIPALGGYDFNNDGVIDVYFAQSQAQVSPGVDATFFFILNDDPRWLTDGTSGEIIWNVDREWLDKKYLYPIPEAALLRNPALGQNPGWD